MRKKLQDYLPPILLKTYEFPLLCETEQPEIDRLHDAADAVLDAQFISTAGEYAISRYEKIFGVVPQDTDTLDERRFKVLTRINTSCRFPCGGSDSSSRHSAARMGTNSRWAAASTR